MLSTIAYFGVLLLCLGESQAFVGRLDVRMVRSFVPFHAASSPLESNNNNNMDPLQGPLQQLQLKEAQLALKETEVNQIQAQIRDIQAAMQRLRAQHVEEMARLMEDLEQNQTLRKQQDEAHRRQLTALQVSHRNELQSIQTAASVELEAATTNLESQVSKLQRELSNAQASLQESQHTGQQQAWTIRKLQNEKRSVRKLLRNVVRLLQARVVSRVTGTFKRNKQPVKNGTTRTPVVAQPTTTTIGMEESIFQ